MLVNYSLIPDKNLIVKYAALSAYLKSFKAYMQLERSFSENTIESYLRDAGLLLEFNANEFPEIKLENLCLKELQKLCTVY